MKRKFLSGSHKIPVLLAACTAAFVGNVTTPAQESAGSGDDFTLEPTVVEGGNEIVDLHAIPEFEDTVTAGDLNRQNATDLSNVFRSIPSVTVNGGRSQGQMIFVNNIESTLLNVTIDGASQGNLSHHQSSVLVDPELLQQVEVVAGAGTALDGPGSLGGAIRFETKNAFDLLEFYPVTIEGGKQPVQELVQDRFGGYLKGTGFYNGDGGRVSGAIYGLLNDEWGYLFSGSYTNRDSYKDGNGDVVEHTGYTRENQLFKLSGRFGDGHELDFSYENFNDEIFSFDRVNISQDFLIASGRPAGLFQQVNSSRQTASLNYDYNPAGNDLVGIESTVFYTDQELERKASAETGGVEIFGLDLRNTSRFSNVEATYGFDFQNKTATSTSNFRPAGGNEEEDVFGAYLQTSVELHPMLEIGGGVRFDDYSYTDIAGQKYDSDAFSPNALVTVKPIENLSITASYAEAYRGVGIREAFFPGIREPNLDGEEAETMKIGFEYDDGFFLASGSVFDQTIDNYLYPLGAGGSGSLGNIENEGYEVKVGVHNRGFHALVGMNYSDPQVTGYDYPDDLGMVVAGRRWVADLGYTFENAGLTVGWLSEYRESVDEVPLPGPFPAVAAKDDYFVHSVYLAWQVPNVEGLSANLTIDNLFDEFYQDHTIYTGSGLASPGREIKLGLKYEF